MKKLKTISFLCILLFLVFAKSAYSQLCPGHVIAPGTGTGIVLPNGTLPTQPMPDALHQQCLNSAIGMALGVGRAICPGRCIYAPGQWVYQRPVSFSQIAQVRYCSVSLRIPCYDAPDDDDDDDDGPEPTPIPTPAPVPTVAPAPPPVPVPAGGGGGVPWWKIAAGILIIGVGVALVLTPIPGDEAVVAGAGAALLVP